LGRLIENKQRSPDPLVGSGRKDKAMKKIAGMHYFAFDRAFPHENN
jgi:hypothetical protein